jgi:hypothetical protein
MSIVDITTAAPGDIDAEICRLSNEIASINAQMNRLDNRRRQRTEIGDCVAAADLSQQIMDLVSKESDLIAQRYALGQEYSRRGWTRYYLVNNSNGHVHSSMACSTCFVTTQYRWLTTESGRTAEDVVADAKAQACTVCFPWAPVTTEHGKYRSTSEEEAEARRVEHDAKAKEILTPAGEPLYAARRGAHGVIENDDLLKTEVAAWRRALSDATDLACYGVIHLDAEAWCETIRRCLEAISPRRQVTAENLKTELVAKALKKAQKEGWETQAGWVQMIEKALTEIL